MKILLIDDHTLFRDGIALLLEGLNMTFDLFEAGSYESAESFITTHEYFDLILLDLGLPGISHLDALQAIREKSPDSPIVVLSGTENYTLVEQTLRQGAQGYIPKSSPAKIMLNALQLVISGGTYIPPEILLSKPGKNTNKKSTNCILEEKLTPRQCEVLHQLSEGKANKEIGRTLNLTDSTVRAHVAAILKAFNVKNRTQAVQYALQNSWVTVAKTNFQ